MKPSTKNQVEGMLHEAKGKVKETAGILTDNSDLESEGACEKVAGKIQGKLGELEKDLEA